MTKTFKIGDRVRVIDASGNGDAREGDLCTVTKVDGGGIDELLYVKADRLGREYGMFSRRFELVGTAPAPTFKQGDIVRYNGGASHLTKGKTYMVSRQEGAHLYVDGNPFGARAVDFTMMAQQPVNPFRVGDQVRYNAEARERHGAVRVRKVAKLGTPFGTCVDSAVSYEGGGWDYVRVLELVETAPAQVPTAGASAARKTWIIIVLRNGKLAPATAPVEYVSESQAKRVAMSMAEKNPGETFMVFQSTAAAYVPPAPKAAFVTL